MLGSTMMVTRRSPSSLKDPRIAPGKPRLQKGPSLVLADKNRPHGHGRMWLAGCALYQLLLEADSNVGTEELPW